MKGSQAKRDERRGQKKSNEKGYVRADRGREKLESNEKKSTGSRGLYRKAFEGNY